MKKILLSFALALFVGAGAANAVLIGDFTIPPATVGQLNTFSNLDTNVMDTWRVNPGSGSGVGAVTDPGDGDGYVQLARNYSNSQRIVLAIWVDVADLGLLPDVNYSLQFDYLVDRVGARAYDANAQFTYAVAAANDVYNQVNGSVSTSVTMSDAVNGSVLLNYGAEAVSTPGQTAWTTFSASETFSFSAGTTKLAVLIQGFGYGVGNNNWPANGEYTYLGIKNISIIPEASTWALFAVGFSSITLLRRRRAGV